MEKSESCDRVKREVGPALQRTMLWQLRVESLKPHRPGPDPGSASPSW